jgi:hypothetical protein
VNDTFVEMRLGADEGGNLWKGDPEGTLAWLGPDESSYHPFYELKTNEAENDWSALVDLTGALEFTPTAALPDSLSPRLEIGSALNMLALNGLTVNLDSYTGTARNYYLYHQDLDGRFLLVNWDCNMAWGVYRNDMSIGELKVLPPFWVESNRPLALRLWERPEFADLYRGAIQRLMAGAAEPDRLIARMEELRDLIRPWVYADSLKMYSNEEFELAMTVNFGSEPALEPFIRERHTFLESEIGIWDPAAYEGLVLNELMADNASTLQDEYNEYDDWIEIANGGDAPLALGDLTLTDDLAFPGAYSLPDLTLQPGEYLIIWADNQPLQGANHAPFRLDAQGESL